MRAAASASISVGNTLSGFSVELGLSGASFQTEYTDCTRCTRAWCNAGHTRLLTEVWWLAPGGCETGFHLELLTP